VHLSHGLVLGLRLGFGWLPLCLCRPIGQFWMGHLANAAPALHCISKAFPSRIRRPRLAFMCSLFAVVAGGLCLPAPFCAAHGLESVATGWIWILVLRAVEALFGYICMVGLLWVCFGCGWCLVSGCPAHCNSPLQVFVPGDSVTILQDFGWLICALVALGRFLGAHCKLWALLWLDLRAGVFLQPLCLAAAAWWCRFGLPVCCCTVACP
jgi:hypothetical protein